jgi:hypothetical protein
VDPLAVVEPEATPLTQASPVELSSPVLRSQDGSTSHAPAFLQARPEAVVEEEVRPKVRRRRAPRSFEGADDAAAPVVASSDED